ncbi:MAG: hypothetical protein PUP93_28220 [Rhizonema sp. NSF051]|nr:hypothetical protein [Rhizonema sp. NSF051]
MRREVVSPVSLLYELRSVPQRNIGMRRETRIGALAPVEARSVAE